MKKYGIPVLVGLISSIILIIVIKIIYYNSIIFNSDIRDYISFGLTELYLASVIFFINMLIVFIAKAISRKTKRRVSGAAVFAITDTYIGLLIIIISVYDIITDKSEFFHGFLGLILMIYVLPVLIIFFIADMIYIAIRNHKNKSKINLK